MSNHRKAWVMVWGSTKPAVSIGYESPMFKSDSGFTVLFDDAPDPDDVPESEPLAHHGISTWCVHCLIEEHPEIGRGFDIARQYGVADLDDDGQWVVGDVSRLDPERVPPHSARR